MISIKRSGLCLMDEKIDGTERKLTLMTTSQNNRCFRIVFNACRNDAFIEQSVNFRKPQSSIASSLAERHGNRN